MAGTAANVVVGMQAANTLKVGAYGDAEGSAVEVGFIDGGVEFEHAEDAYLVYVDQAMGAIDRKTTKESLRIKLNLAEATLANLAVAYGYPTTALSSVTLSIGGKTSNTARSLFINVNAVSSGTRKYTFYKCFPDGNSVHSYKKDDKTMYTVTFEVMEDTSKTAEQRFGTVVDSSTDTTPPTVALSTPVDGGTVTKDAAGTVTWTITEATNAIDENTVIYGAEDNATFMIINTTTPGSAALVAGTIAYSAATKNVVFTPTSSWTASDTFQVIVTTGLRDTAGNHLATPKIEQFSVTA